jgi:hypothetical protein
MGHTVATVRSLPEQLILARMMLSEQWSAETHPFDVAPVAVAVRTDRWSTCVAAFVTIAAMVPEWLQEEVGVLGTSGVAIGG